MNRTFLKLAWLLIGLAGCHSLGGYSAQSLTRVPPIGTGTYQVPGSYYGNAGAPANAAANVMSTTGGMTAAAPSSTAWPDAASGIPSTMPQASTAGYSTAPSASLSNPAVTTASGSGSSSGNDNLQWQR